MVCAQHVVWFCLLASDCLFSLIHLSRLPIWKYLEHSHLRHRKPRWESTSWTTQRNNSTPVCWHANGMVSPYCFDTETARRMQFSKFRTTKSGQKLKIPLNAFIQQNGAPPRSTCVLCYLWVNVSELLDWKIWFNRLANKMTRHNPTGLFSKISEWYSVSDSSFWLWAIWPKDNDINQSFYSEKS